MATKTKISVSLDDKILKELDKQCKALGLPKSAFINDVLYNLFEMDYRGKIEKKSPKEGAK